MTAIRHEANINLTAGPTFRTLAFLPLFDRMRADGPVHRREDDDGTVYWSVVTHATAVRVLRDHNVFVSGSGMRLGGAASAVAFASQRMMVVSDDQKHAQLRQGIGGYFTAKAIGALSHQVDPLADELVADAVSNGAVDVMTDVAQPLPARVIAHLLGVGASDGNWIAQRTRLATESVNTEESIAANAELFAYLSDLLRQRSSVPGTDIASHLASYSGSRGQMLTEAEVLLNIVGVVTGANDTTSFTIGSAIYGLCERPDQFQLLKTDGADIDVAVEEILRWASSAVHCLRTTAVPVLLEGNQLEPGDTVVVWLPAANRDPNVFLRPHQLDLDRQVNPHLAFGSGRHGCVGARLARVEVAALLRSLVRRVGQLEEICPTEWGSSNFTHGPVRLRVSFLPAFAGTGRP
jgi:cytochrome P450